MTRLTTQGNKILRTSLVLILSTVILWGCEDRWKEMNTDPNRLTDLPDEYLFTSAVRGAFTTSMGFIHVDYGGQYSHIFIGSAWRREIDKYNSHDLPDDLSDLIFKDLYQGPIRNSVETMVLTGEGKYKNEMRHAQARIINVINFSKLTDLFGDIPYFEGGMGKYGELQPKYDKQEDIYNDMLEKLGECINTLKNGDPLLAYPAGIDPIYNGDVQNWVRMANSLRLRLAVRAVQADSKYSDIIDECLMEMLIEENSQNATLTTWDSENGSLYNPWYNNIINYNGGIYPLLWSEYFIDLLKNSNDPRLSFFATRNRDDEFKGMPNGLVDQHASLPSFATWDKSNTSRPTEEFFARDQPLYLISASEVWLLRAEMALKGLGSGDPDELFKKGIESNMLQWDIDPDNVAQYLSDEDEGTLNGSADEQLEKIATQLYISSVPNTLEAWSTIRRTGYPHIPQRTAENLARGVTDGYIPLRLNYPSNVEASVNRENLQIAIDRLGGEDRIDAPVWWDKN